MKIYIVRQTIKKVSRYKLDSIVTNLYGAYSKREDAVKRGKKIVNEAINNDGVTIIRDTKRTDNEILFHNRDVIILSKGNGYSEEITHFIEILNMELKEGRKII